MVKKVLDMSPRYNRYNYTDSALMVNCRRLVVNCQHGEKINWIFSL